MRLDLQRVEEAPRDHELVETTVPRVLRLVDRLDRAVTGALRVSRGRGAADRGDVQLGSLLELAAQSARPEFELRGATLSLDLAPTIPPLVADAAALEQVFVNLFVNAAHALEPGGTARVSVSSDSRRILITVADNGVGMNQTRLSEIVRPFNSSKRDGTGLGLKVARRIVESHRGVLSLESVAGEGTRVTVDLPRSAT
jgi:hypothetical protein